MLTVLTIEDRVKDTKWGRVRSHLSIDTIKSQTAEGKVPVHHIKYINRTGRVNWKRIEKVTGHSTPVLYSGDSVPSENTCIKFFEGREHSKRLCGNMALAVLGMMDSVPKNLRIGLWDPRGEYWDLSEAFLRFTDNLIVVTKNLRFYREVAEQIMDESGAVLCVSSDVKSLCSCGLIISPDAVDFSFTPATGTVLLSGERPLVSVSCFAFYRYCFSLKGELAECKPRGISTELFAAGLYSLCGIYELGSLVPLVCSGDSRSHTTLSLRRYLRDCFGT